MKISTRSGTSRVRQVVVAIIAVCAVAAVWAVVVEPGRVRVREVTIILERWPPALAGVRIAVLGDIHTGSPHVSPAKLRAIVADVNAAHPDVVVLLGDYVIHGIVGGRFVEPETTAEILGGLRAPGGVVAVLGNHDWWLDGTRVRAALEANGIPVLENQARPIEHNGARLWLGGLADLWTRQVDIDGTLAAVPPAEPVVFLTHNPDVFPGVPARVALTLAAHTHGGQVRVPPFPPPLVPSRYGARFAAGHIVEGGRHLFVTTGVGMSILPVRFAVPPEVAILTIR
jgi:predicted MPP superfamily phosphohydrolase